MLLRCAVRTAARTLPLAARSIPRRQFSRILQHVPRSATQYNRIAIPCTRWFSAEYPAHYRIDMPALSPTMEAGTIVSWSVAEGDELGEGELLAQIETDKATMDFEAPEVGYLAKILVAGGTPDVKLGVPLCIIVENKEDVAKFADYVAEAAPAAAPVEAAPPPPPAAPAAPVAPVAAAPAPVPVAAPVAPAAPAPVAAPVAPAAPVGEARIFASPMARTLAARKGIDLSMLGSGSGPDGAIRAADVEALQAAPVAVAAPAAPAAPVVAAPALVVSPDGSFTEIPLTNMRKAIAKRLTQSKQEVPHYYLTVDIAIDELMATRAKLNSENTGKFKLSVTDFLIKACGKALVDVPAANSQWADTCIKQFHNADISVAVATDTGLITPIVFTANNKGLTQINSDMKDLKEKAFSGKLQPHEFQGGTFTISNLGMMGITDFTAIINPPQSCILAIGSPEKKLIPADNEKGFEVITNMKVTLSSDHRVVDGAVGSEWLKAFKTYLEKPLNMLL